MSASSGKRRAAEDVPAGDPGDDLVSRTDLKGILAELRTSVVNELSDSISKTIDTKFTAQVEKAFRTYDEKITNRLSDHDMGIADLVKRADTVEQSQKKMKEDINKLQRALAVAESAATEVVQQLELEQFDRQPDPAVLRANTSESVAKEAVLAAFATLFKDADIPDDGFEMVGGTMGISKNFTFRLLGAPGLAARRARKVLDMRRRPDGSWAPNPQVTTPLGRRIDIFLSPDKSPKQLRTELGGRRLFKAFKSAHPNKTVHLDKRAGMVSIDWHPCARVVPAQEQNSYTVQWNPTVVIRAQIDKEGIMSAFNANNGGTAGVQWEI